MSYIRGYNKKNTISQSLFNNINSVNVAPDRNINKIPISTFIGTINTPIINEYKLIDNMEYLQKLITMYSKSCSESDIRIRVSRNNLIDLNISIS